MEAVKNGDPNAATGMMAGFKGKAKFLLPLIRFSYNTALIFLNLSKQLWSSHTSEKNARFPNEVFYSEDFYKYFPGY